MERYFFTGRNDSELYVAANKSWYIKPSDIKRIIENL